MIYTLLFYIITFLLASEIRDRKKAMRAVFVFAAIYMGMRYNYPSDYPAYQGYFNMCNGGGYYYDEADHMEYGWYLLNRLFAPFGWYIFVAFVSCIFLQGLYYITDVFVPKQFFPLVILGVFAMGNFEILMSAQRQIIVAGIFMIAFRKLLYQRIQGLADLIKIRTLLYFAVIFLCYYFHKSALFLWIVPFFYVLPSRSFLVIVGVVISAILIYVFGDIYLVDLFEQLQEQSGEYEYMIFTGEYSGTISILQASMWLFQFFFVAQIYLKYNYDNNEKVVMLISMLSILIVISGYSLGQIARLSHYTYMFTFMSVSIIASKLKGKKIANLYMSINWIWVLWNVLKVFSIPRGTLHEYKFLLLNL